jgi:hypothetical protein
MKTSENISNLTKALLKAQVKMGAAVKGAKNPFFKSSYADLPTVMEVVKEPLNEEGIVVLQPASHRDGKNFIITALVHSNTGEMLVSETEVICAKQNDPQSFGAAQTYARRFGLQSMLFIPAEDDDGNTASGRQAPAKTYVAPAAKVAAASPPPPPQTEVAVETPASQATTTNSPASLAGKTSNFRKPKKEVVNTAPIVNGEAVTTPTDWV